MKYEIRNQCYVPRHLAQQKKTMNVSPLHKLQAQYDRFLQGLISNPNLKLKAELPRGEPKYPNVEFFTTNYDDALETFFDWAGVPITDGYVEDMAAPGISDQIAYRFDETEFDDAAALRIYKLYGSIMYARQNSTITRIEPYTWSLPSHRRDFGDLLIYPGATKVIWNEPQLQLFYRLHERLRDPSTRFCIVIGYSFSDQVITDIFKDSLALNPSIRVYIVGPQAKTIARKKFAAYHSVKAVQKSFEKVNPVRDFR
jgi:hypothetical protein